MPRWVLPSDKRASVIDALRDLDRAYDERDAVGIGKAADFLIDFDESKRGPISGLGGQKDPSAPDIPQTPLTSSGLIDTLLKKNEAAQRAAENGSDRKGEDRA